jgi:hypothetical protein
MHLSSHTGGIWWFWHHIWNLLKIWTQKTYRPTYVVLLWVNLILGLEYQNIHSKGDRPDMKIPSSDPPSAHWIGPDDVLMTSVGGCYMMSFRIALINLIIAEAIDQLWRFCVQILNLHKKKSRHRLNHSISRRSSNLHFSHHHWFCYIGSYSENFMFLCSDMNSPQKLV